MRLQKKRHEIFFKIFTEIPEHWFVNIDQVLQNEIVYFFLLLLLYGFCLVVKSKENKAYFNQELFSVAMKYKTLFPPQY